MPREQCYWTRSLELQLVDFVRQREFIWKPVGNTNYQLQQKYKAYAEFAAQLGRGFTARSVRDRWVNIRSTFHHNLRRVERSRKTASKPTDLYIPSWPLWRPLQFLRQNKNTGNEIYNNTSNGVSDLAVKEELPSDIDEANFIPIRQRGQRTDRPRKKLNITKKNKCHTVVNELVQAMKPFDVNEDKDQKFWFFGKHVTESLNNMKSEDAKCAGMEIAAVLEEFSLEELT